MSYRGVHASIIEALERGPMTKREIAYITGAKYSTVDTYVSYLKRYGFVTSREVELDDYRGRPEHRYQWIGK